MSQMTIVGGVHGAGKSTLCRELQEADPQTRYLTNEEVRRLADAPLTRAEVHAALREHVERCFASRAAFVFEHVMSGRFVETLLEGAQTHGFAIHLVYLDLPNAAASLARITARIAAGGHDVEREKIAARLAESRENFWTKFRPRSSSWTLYDGSAPERRMLAQGHGADVEIACSDGFEAFHRRRAAGSSSGARAREASRSPSG